MQKSHLQNDMERSSVLAAFASPALDEAFHVDVADAIGLDTPASWLHHIPFGQWLISALRPRLVADICVEQSPVERSTSRTVARLHLGTVFSAIASSDKQTANHAFADGAIDLLHVTHLAVDDDFPSLFATWKPKLSQHAVIVIHRIVDDAAARTAWAWLKALYPHFEFTHAEGLGVAAVGSDVLAALVPLFAAQQDRDDDRIRERFATLGEGWSQRARAREAQQLRETAQTLQQAIRQERRNTQEAERARQQIAVRLSTVRRDLFESQVQTDAMRASTDVIRAERDLAIRERDAILTSRAWFVTTRLIGVAVRFPRASRLAWRLARLAWWTVTLQLFRRLREWRSIRATLAAQARAAATAQVAPAPAPVPANNVPVPAEKSEPALSGYLAVEAEAAATLRAAWLSFMKSEERLSFPAAMKPEVSVVVIARGPAYGLHQTLKTLRACAGAPLEVIVVEAAADKSAEFLDRVDGIARRRTGSSDEQVPALNLAARQARGSLLVFIEDSAFLDSDSLEVAHKRLADATVGAIAGRIVRACGLVWEAGGMVCSNGELATYGYGFAAEQGEVMFRRPVDYGGSTLIITRKDTFDRIGGFDEHYAALPYAYADYAMRLSTAGLAVTYEPEVVANVVVLDHEKRTHAAVRSDGQRLSRQHSAYLASSHLPAYAQNSLAGRARVSAGTRRLLMIDNEVPYRALGSGYPRANEMLWVAAELGWTVTLFPLRRSDFDWQSARLELPLEIEIIKRHGSQALRDLLEERRGYYQAILVSRPDNMEMFQDSVRDAPDLLLGTRLIYDAEAVFAKRELVRAALEGNPYSDEQASAMLDAEAKIADGADSITCVTEAEKEFFNTRHDVPVHVISHSVRQNSQSPGFSDRKGFLFIGRLLEPGSPNWMGLKWFIQTCWPAIRSAIPDATLTVIGHLYSEHPEFDQPGVRLLGAIDDLAPYYDKARIFVAPIRFAAGVPIKILEAAAAGLPVAGTSLMAEQMRWTPGVEIIADDDPARLTQACVHVYESADAWNAMRETAQAQIAQTYSPDAFRKNMDAVLSGRQDQPLQHEGGRPSSEANHRMQSESASSV